MATKKKARKKKASKPARKAKSAKKASRKKTARKSTRSSGGTKLRRLAAKASAVGPAQALGDWSDNSAEEQNEEIGEDDIPPEYGGSE